jgi:CubicO group peptidase (beta-lactamase class C family)
MNLPRRTFLRGAGAGLLVSSLKAAPALSNAPLDEFIGRYLQAMNAPGLTLALANKNGPVRTAGFGYSDVELKTPVTPELLFEIGSITKSFVALTLLQLREEGKLDLQKPILDYLPWLPIETNYGAITVHHLLTHSSGLPDALSLFLSDPKARHLQGFKPGEHFHYCNLGFSALGYLIQKLDGRTWPEAVRARIFLPLGMTMTRAIINDRTKAGRARSYVPFYADTTYPRSGRLTRAPELVFDDAAGSITSTPGDMAFYLQMLLNRGQHAHGRIVSEESFAAFSKPYIEAPEFSPTAFYGYGIGVDKLDGHTILRHTGGMVSFASSIHVDLDGGVAAFASINAMQGYRPTPVTQFAVQLMNGTNPIAPALPSAVVADAGDYAGVYSTGSGKQLEVIAEAGRLTIHAAGAAIALEQSGGDAFVATAAGWESFPLLFGRTDVPPGSHGKGQVVELAYGSDWYTNTRYQGSRTYPEPAELQAFTGFYQSESAWSGSVRIVLRKGTLWADGAIPLQPIGNGLFRMGDESYVPDTAEFHHMAEGKAQLLKSNGADYWRMAME